VTEEEERRNEEEAEEECTEEERKSGGDGRRRGDMPDLDIGEVNVDEARHGDNVGDALHALPQHVVG